MDSIVHVAWGDRHFIVATTFVAFVAMHLVWTEEATNTPGDMYKDLEYISGKHFLCAARSSFVLIRMFR